MILRPYQQRNLNEILACLQRGVKGTVYVCPTGGGKTLTAVNVIRTVVKNGWEAAFFVHRRELLKQASKTLKRHGIPHGLIAPGHDLTEHPVHVASVDTFRSRFKRLEPWLKTIKLVVIDEAHHAPAGGFKRILQSMAADACALGLTATPFRLDGKGLREFFSEQVKAPTIADLTTDGYLSPAHVHQPPLKISTAGIATRGGDFVQSDLAKRMDDDELTRATVANYARYAAGVPTIAFCAGVDHAKHVAERFSEAGWRAESVDGTLSTGERDRRIKALGTGELQILTSCDIISEGCDVPIVGGAILLRPTKSTGLYLQQCLDSETEILTKRGWVGYEDISRDDVAAGFDRESEAIEWVDIDEITRRPLAEGEEMFAIRSPHLDIRVTGQHDIIVKGKSPTCARWQKQAAEDVARRRSFWRIPISGVQDVGDASLSDDEVRFIGWFLSDGTRNKTTNAISISQSARKTTHCDEIRRVLDGCGLKYGRCYVKRTGEFAHCADNTMFTISYGSPRGRGKHLRGWKHLEPWIDKSIPEIYETLSARQVGILIEALYLGDGANGQTTIDWTPRTKVITTGNNEVMADRLQSVFVRRGFRCNKSKYENNGNGPWYYLHVSEKNNSTIAGTNINDGHIVGKQYKRSRFSHDTTVDGELVWCVSNRLGTLVTRRNGKVSILGNCGRVLRPYPGKDASIVIDMVGNVKTHGMPDANRVWSLHDGIDKSQREKIVERTRRCPKRGCWRVHEWAEKCPGCGYVYPANPLNNRAPGAPIYMPKNGLMGFTAEQIQSAKLSDLMRLKPNEQELKVIARVKGYKPGWVWFQLKQREEMKQRFRSRWR